MLDRSKSIFPQAPAAADLEITTCQTSNCHRAHMLIDLIKQEIADFSPKIINKELTEFFAGITYEGVGFSTGLQRLEDHFILDGLESAFKKILRGQAVNILEHAAGTSFPATPTSHRHTGHPWLARTIAKALAPYNSLAHVTVADKHSDFLQFVLRDGKGKLIFFSISKNNLNVLPEDFTSLNKPASFDKLLKLLTEEQAQYLVSKDIRVQGARFFLRPLLDPDFEALFNLSVRQQSYFDYPKADSEKYDYIFSRHSIQKDNPHFMGDNSFQILVEATRRQLKADGEARLVFDHPYMPKACVIIRQDSYTTRHILPVLGMAF